MLTNDQKLEIEKNLKLGFSDVAIAKKLGLKQMQVYSLRTRLGISAAEVVASRYAIWARLITESQNFTQGEMVARIAQIYEIKEKSVRITLWNIGFSFKEARKSKAPKTKATAREEVCA